MTKRKWHSGPPPHVGWWQASVGQLPWSWRWWDGQNWSAAATPTDSASSAALFARQTYPRKGYVEWTNYWPPNARVPRIDPRKVKT